MKKEHLVTIGIALITGAFGLVGGYYVTQLRTADEIGRLKEEVAGFKTSATRTWDPTAQNFQEDHETLTDVKRRVVSLEDREKSLDLIRELLRKESAAIARDTAQAWQDGLGQRKPPPSR